ncbi:uncharacterized protein KGF55_004715 [Candida pseudojiufengensis]|uniref:uncharacterized protein n=1 Tax=Candida pseudojiufengensis TaxID=497109 RepID=UPI002225187A|nr:uncharacterized protein KGF55_004715 [Candida pseudojiufengensis]KAI5960423.1 hypothetical protein KGF55_004715 [Candida pseudojiufengensis]
MPTPSHSQNKVKKPKKPYNAIPNGKHMSAKKAASYLHSVNQSQNHPNSINSISSSASKTQNNTEPNWNPKHFRLFVGNLGPDATNELLRNAFSKYQSLSNVYIPIDKHSRKPKGFGFVAFENSEDYLHAFQDMNNKYIGQYPVQLKRAESSIPKKHKKKY